MEANPAVGDMMLRHGCDARAFNAPGSHLIFIIITQCNKSSDLRWAFSKQLLLRVGHCSHKPEAVMAVVLHPSPRGQAFACELIQRMDKEDAELDNEET